MFVAWAVLSGLAGTIHTSEFPAPLEALRSRSISPGKFLIEPWDEKFTDEDLNQEGNAFARDYYVTQPSASGVYYFADYERVLGEGLPSLYHAADTWENYERLKPIIDERFSLWRTRKS